MEGIPVLTTLIFLPGIGAALLYLLPAFKVTADPEGNRARMFATLLSLVVLALAIAAASTLDHHLPGFQFEEESAWIPSIGVSYYLGVDAVSLLLVLLTSLLMPIVFFTSSSIRSMRRGYVASMLILEMAMIGTFAALDLLLFYVFWELMLFPMYFIIGIWGGARRFYATIKFVLYTVSGSLLMLVALLYVAFTYYQQNGELSFRITDILARTYFTMGQELWLFAGLAIAFAVKIPIFPFHTWLPDAHVEAPTGGSVILAGVLLKMGLYGFLRFAWPLFPRAAEYFAPALGLLAIIGIICGALVAWAQTDMKKLVAYSSISHLGLCVLGLAAFSVTSLSGSVYQMLNHGISTGALFLLVGVLYDRKHTRLMEDYGGLASRMPFFAFSLFVFMMSSIGLPATNGFVGEFLILSGSFPSRPWLAALALIGVILGAVYMLGMYLRTMFGEVDEKKNGNVQDMNKVEIAAILPLLVLVFVMGVYPAPFLGMIDPSIERYTRACSERKIAMIAAENSASGELGAPLPGEEGGQK